MDDTRLCACGCGEEVKRWKNNTISPFLRGHHMRKAGYIPPNLDEVKFCLCGCGTQIVPLKNGHMRDYIKNHHLKGKSFDLEHRKERCRKRWQKEPTLSPYLENIFISFDKSRKRWYACVLDEKRQAKSRTTPHANAVYQHHFGEIPKGYVVHHKNGRHDRLEDDRPENLMLLPDEWNLRFFPVLAKGFGVPERVVTKLYEELNLSVEDDGIFSALCCKLIEFTKAKKAKK